MSEKRDARRTRRQARRETRRTVGEIPKAKTNRWQSYLDVQTVQAVEIFRPESLSHLQRITELAADNDQTVKAIGSGHSFSEIGTTDGYFVLTDRLDDVLPFGPEQRAPRLRPEHREREDLVEVEVGITIIELSKHLESIDRALFNQGTYDGQTLWGAVSTSTHGSGISRPAFPDAVLSMVVVGENGRSARIEPSDGITDPERWNEPGIDDLIQDDRVFYSQVCSFGCMGLTYSAIIETRDFYWLDEWNYITTWDIFKAAFAEPEDLTGLVESWDNFECLVVPTQAERGEKDGVSFAGEYPMSLTFRRETDQRRTVGALSAANLLDRLTKLLEGTLVDPLGLLSLFGGTAEGRWWRPRWARLRRDPGRLAEQSVKFVGKHGWLGGALDPDALPIDRRNKCHKIFPKGGKLFGGYGLELAFPVERTIEMMDRIIELAEDNEDDGIFHTGPVAIRFVEQSSAYASPQFGRRSVMLEVLMAKGTKDGPQALERIEREMLDEPDVRVHWGLHVDRMSADNHDFAAAYPRWNEFVETFDQFNTDGTFENDFTDRIGLS